MPKGKGKKIMPAGINYHLHVRTSYSKDGYIVLWKIDPQKELTTMEISREMTHQEIINHVKERKQFGLKPWLNRSILNKVDL